MRTIMSSIANVKNAPVKPNFVFDWANFDADKHLYGFDTRCNALY